ncbi:hypothetical protein ACS127_01580 [Amphibacillus sp. Q70]|uniref:hypothetical protein n=1 Tax=Amphibacillus sp. Q70 TaxID=3453416 RepID=UPI003F83EF04
MNFIWLFLVTAIFCLVGALLGVFFIGFVKNPKIAELGAMLIVMPQIFLSEESSQS